MKTWKIYKHTLLVSSHKGWSYIGLTSQNLKKRWRGGSGYKQEHQSIFYNAIQKHGGNNTWNTVWSHELLEDNIESLEKANEREKYWIAYYHTWIGDPNCRGYNMTPGGDGAPGHKCSEFTKAKISQANKGKAGPMLGKHLSKEHKENLSLLHSKKVICIETQQIFNSAIEAKKLLNVSNISKVCHKQKKTAGGYHWAFADDLETINNLKQFIGKDKFKKEQHYYKKVLCIETGIIYNSAKEAKIATGFTHIDACCRDQRRTAGGYHWKYIKES